MTQIAQPSPVAAASGSIGDEHVLQWLPPHISPGGVWELLPRAVFKEQGPTVPARMTVVAIEAPADASPERLAGVVAAQLGYPVTLQAGEQRLKRFWHFRPFAVYLVRPAATRP